MSDTKTHSRPRVIVVGGGFGGIRAVTAMASSAVDITLIDRRNHHVFQPLLYEVATAALSPGQIAMPLRRIFRRQENVTVMLGEVNAIDLQQRVIQVDDTRVGYDFLVVATGSTHHYFGNDEWSEHARGLKSIEDAVAIRRDFLLAFEKADRSHDAEERSRWMTTVIVGGGATGIELAGTMSDVARRVLTGEFRNLDPASLRIVLAEGTDRLLPAMPAELSERARRDLEKLGVEIRLNTTVTDVDDDGVTLSGGERLTAANVIWAAGVRGAAPQKGLDSWIRSDGRIDVAPDLSIPGHPNVFAIGDLAYVNRDGVEVPGLAPAAMQMGDYVGRLIVAEIRRGTPQERAPFKYWDKGTLATIGRGKAVAHIGRFKFGGLVAWLLWVFIHVLFLVGFRNRFVVLVDWAFAYLTFHRGARLITDDPEAADT